MAKNAFQPGCLPVLIGSVPLTDHQAALDLTLRWCPDIPVWPQLPRLAAEQMVAQFAPGMPGLTTVNGSLRIDMGSPAFGDEIVGFYEDYLRVTESGQPLDTSRFALTEDRARCFFLLERHLARLTAPPAAVKGQVTGPVTFTTALKDEQGKAIIFDDQLRDAAVKLLALKARFQVRRLKAMARPVIVFIDEPALAGFGSSELIGVSADQVKACLAEVIAAIQADGGLAGIHVCANTDWDIVLGSGTDIVNFDAHGYFDRFVLFAEGIRRFITQGGILAWGIVPTGAIDSIAHATVEALADKWQAQVAALAAIGLDAARIKEQSLLSPSCGTGSLSVETAEKVLALTRGLSDRLRESFRR